MGRRGNARFIDRCQQVVSKLGVNKNAIGEISHEKEGFWGAGAEGQNRTVDTGIFSAVLYQLSYLGRVLLS